MNRLILLFFFIVLISCGKKELNVSTTREYFKAIAAGDFMKADEYLSANFMYEDVIFKQEYPIKEDYVKSIAPDPELKYHCDHILKLQNVSAINDSMVWVQGEYCSYTYKNKEIAPMRFTSTLYFNSNGKINRQEDWKDHSLEGILSMYQFRQSFIGTE